MVQQAPARFQVGSRVKITGKKSSFKGKTGTVSVGPQSGHFLPDDRYSYTYGVEIDGQEGPVWVDEIDLDVAPEKEEKPAATGVTAPTAAADTKTE